MLLQRNISSLILKHYIYSINLIEDISICQELKLALFMMQIYLSVSTIEHKLIRKSIFLRLSITLFRESHQIKKT